MEDEKAEREKLHDKDVENQDPSWNSFVAKGTCFISCIV